MSDHKEKLSAFLDDGLQRDESLDADRESARTLQHYNLIGTAMRGELNEATMLDISNQVRQAIDADSAGTVTPAAAAVDEVAAGRRSWFDFSSWLQPVGGLAIAASVAMIAVVSLDQSGEPGVTGPATVAGNDAVEATMDAAEIRAVASSRELPVIVPANDIRLEQYLDEHSEFAASDTLQGRLPYVRAVGYKTRAR